MADSPLLHREAAPGVLCQRCGRVFEAPIEIEGEDGKPVKVGGHVQGNPVLCVPVGPEALRNVERDARRRRDNRRGR